MYTVTIDNFEGPLDLLLHLVKEKEMDLLNLELSKITDQYLLYIQDSIKNLHLEIASEYLVMAAYLLELKSKMLLPSTKVEIEDEYEEDPRELLIRRLIEYKKYKDVLDDFKENFEERKKIHTKIPNSLQEYTIDHSNQIPSDLEIYDLVKAMQKLFQRKILLEPLQTAIAKKEYSIEDRVNEIKKILSFRNIKRIRFEDLFEITEKDFYIVTFLAVLDLVNKKELTIQQNKNFDEIYLEVLS